MVEGGQAALGSGGAKLPQVSQRDQKPDGRVSFIYVRPLFAFSGIAAALVLLVGIAAEPLLPGLFSVSKDSLLQPVMFFFPAFHSKTEAVAEVLGQQTIYNISLRSALEKLRIRGGFLRPPFSPNISEYWVELDEFEPHVVPSIDVSFSINHNLRQEQLTVSINSQEFSCDHPEACVEVQSRVELETLGSPPASCESCTRMPYQVVLIEVLPRPTAQSFSPSYLGILRVRSRQSLHSRRLGVKVVPDVSEQTQEVDVQPDPESAVVPGPESTPEGSKITLSVGGGICMQVAGPLADTPNDQPEENRLTRSMGLWSASTRHVFCFKNEASKEKIEVDFTASVFHPNGRLQSGGQYGFGRGVAVGLRPNVETAALWPLESGVRSLGLAINQGESFRLLAVLTQVDNAEHITPVVMMRRLHPEWPVVVRLVNTSAGDCTPVPAMGAARFVCHTQNGNAGHTVHLVASIVAQEAWTIQVMEREYKKQIAETTANHAGIHQPWVGWRARAPQGQEVQQWKLTLRRSNTKRDSPAATTSRLPDTMHFEVALTSGDGKIPWRLDGVEKSVLEGVGAMLSLAALVVMVAIACALALAVLDLPVPMLAMLRPLSSAALMLQFLVLLGFVPHGSSLLRHICKYLAWLAPVPLSGLLYALGCLVFTAVVHGMAVLRYFMRNGTGSAEKLPHGLLLGSWELRVLSLVALPLAASSSALLWELHAEYTAHGSWLMCLPSALLGSAVLVCLMVLGVVCFSTLHSWYMDELVMPVKMPGTKDHIFVDRVCDQLRALPCAPGRLGLLGDWPASVGWCAAPAVGMIYDLEHRGIPHWKQDESTRSIIRTWPDSPWANRRGSKEDSIESQRSSIRGDLQAPHGLDRSVSSLSCLQDSMSKTIIAHPIRAKMAYTYAGRPRGCIAGTASLPWLDVAVPADTLCGIECMIGDFSVQVNVGQLYGPLTGGRLAACFDWGERLPWRWPIDLLVRLLLGVYVGSLPFAGSSKILSSPWLHVSVSLFMVVLAVLVLKIQPYTHFVDNAGLAIAFMGMAVSTALYAMDDQLPGLAPATIAALAALHAIPLVLSLAAATLVLVFSIRLRGLDLHDRVLPRVVKHWGSASTGTAARRSWQRSKSDNLNIGSLWEEDASSNANPDSAAAYSHVANVILHNGLEAKSGKIELPAYLRPSLVQVDLQPGVCPAEASSSTVRLPMPAGLLFTPSLEGLERAVSMPFAALVTADGGQLVYDDARHNGGMHWKEAVRCFFANNPALAAKAESSLQDYEEEILTQGNELTVVLQAPHEHSSGINGDLPPWRVFR